MSLKEIKKRFMFSCSFLSRNPESSLEKYVIIRFDGEKFVADHSDESKEQQENESETSQQITGGLTLVANPSDEAVDNVCIFKIQPVDSHPTYIIEAVDLICSAKHMEIYTPGMTYVTTERGSRVDEALGYHRKTFMLQHSFEEEAPSGCILKLPGITELWLRSIYITVNLCERSRKSLPSLFGPSIDMNTVTNLLNGMNMSKEAHGLLETLTNKEENKKMSLNGLGEVVSSILSFNSIGRSSRATSAIDQQNHNVFIDTRPVLSNAPNKFSEEKQTAPIDRRKDVESTDIARIENSLKNHMEFLITNLERKIMLRLDSIEEMISEKIKLKELDS